LACPELIPDIEKFLAVAIFKMAAAIPHKLNIARFQRPELIPDIDKFVRYCGSHWRTVEIFQCRESIWDIIIYPQIKF
jgi:hypothetical protein